MATTELNYPNTFNRELILDLTLQAFSIYNIGHEQDDAAPRIHDYIPISKSIVVAELSNVFDENGVIVTDSAGENVTVPRNTTANRARDRRRHTFKYLSTQGTDITLAEYRDYSFFDWVSYNNVGFDASAWLFTGYDLGGDIMRKKQAVYIVTHCNRTEIGRAHV